MAFPEPWGALATAVKDRYAAVTGAAVGPPSTYRPRSFIGSAPSLGGRIYDRVSKAARSLDTACRPDAAVGIGYWPGHGGARILIRRDSRQAAEGRGANPLRA